MCTIIQADDYETGRDYNVDPELYPLFEDAFLVFRALCILSMNQLVEGYNDPANVRVKIVSLELLKILLENSGGNFK